MASSSHQIQSSERPPAQPAYVLRGHSAQIHAVHFLRGNSRLLTGDADGFVVLWSTSTKRAVAVWNAHSSTILGLASWEKDKIITHARDNKLCVWQFRQEDEAIFATTLPIDDPSAERKSPWLLHTLQVNALNFCSFAMVVAMADGHNGLPSGGILIATPGVQDGHVNITSLPDEERITTIPNPKDISSGMVMALGLHFQVSGSTAELVVVVGYESGHASVYQQQGAKRQWQLVYMEKVHSQPVLSLGLSPTQAVFFTSSADAIIARHPLGKSSTQPKNVQTRHAGQQDLTVRADGMIFATAGWDSRVRVYSVKTMKELAVLKWHKEGCYALAFADVGSEKPTVPISNLISGGEGTESSAVTERELTVAERREEVAITTHWLAAGSKDGKVSLWQIY